MPPRRSARSSAASAEASPPSAKASKMDSESPERRKSAGGGAKAAAAAAAAGRGMKGSDRSVLGQKHANGHAYVGHEQESESPQKQVVAVQEEEEVAAALGAEPSSKGEAFSEQEKAYVKSLSALLRVEGKANESQLNAHSMFRKLQARSTARSSSRARISNADADASTSGLLEVQHLQRSGQSSSKSKNPELLFDWDAFKMWPQGMELEEQSLLDYFRRLKFIQIEQETKNLFVKFISDEEMEFFEPADVANLEREASELKRQLKDRKEMFRAERKVLQDLAARFGEVDQLRHDLEAVEELQGSIDDMELELARLRVVGGGADGGASSDHGHLGSLLDQSFSSSHGVEVDDAGESCPLPRLLFDPPRRGTLTQDELAKIGDRQNDAIVWLEDAKEKLASEAGEAKRELAKSHKALDRLMAERSQVERFAAEMQQQQQAASRKRRHGAALGDEDEERKVNLATLGLLKSLVSLSSISSTDRLTLEMTLGVLLSDAAKDLLKGAGKGPAKRKKSKQQQLEEQSSKSSVRLVVRFVEQNNGRRLSALEIRRPAVSAGPEDGQEEAVPEDDDCLLEIFAPPGSIARMRIQEAIDGDHLALLLQEAITCVEGLA